MVGGLLETTSCLPPDYKVPTIHKCPHKDHKVLVDVNAINNVAYLRNPGITANNWEGQPLHVSLSKNEFHHCQCSESLEVVTATAVDQFGQTATCRFWVSVEDYYKPIFEHCPNDHTVPYMERVSWKEPTVTDNVGVRELTRPKYNNNTRFSPGTYHVVYSAYDWSGNVAECSFKITVLGDEHSMSDDRSSVISGSVIGAMFIGLVFMSLAFLRLCRKRNVLRSMLRDPRQHTSSVTSNSVVHDNPVFTTHDNGLPPYETVATNKPPEYTTRVNPPSYDEMYQFNDIRGHDEDNYCSSLIESPVNKETTSGQQTYGLGLQT